MAGQTDKGRLIMTTIREKLSRIRLLATDFDGVMTDGSVYVDQTGIEMVRCSRKDGLGISMLKRAGIPIVVISKEPNPVVAVRCKKLGIPCFHGIENGEAKLKILQEYLLNEKIDPADVAYVGDDLNDLEVLKYVGVSLTVKDAHPEVLKICDYIATRPGGGHAFREICELILTSKGLPLKY